MRQPLLHKLDQLSTYRWARNGVRMLLRAAWLSVCVWCIALGGHMLWGWPLRTNVIGAVALATIGSAVALLLRPRLSPRAAAGRLDRRFHLDEQLATAVEVAATNPPPGSIAARLLMESSHTAELLRVFPVLRGVPALERRAEGRPETAEPQELRRRAFMALRALLGAIADDRPLLVHIDDLQWADVDSVALLEQVLHAPGAPALFLVGSFRSEALGKINVLGELLSAAERLGKGAQVQRLELSLNAGSKDPAYDDTSSGVGRVFRPGDVRPDSCPATYAGYLVVNGELRPLPIGSSLDPAGTFFWQPGPGYFGSRRGGLQCVWLHRVRLHRSGLQG